MSSATKPQPRTAESFRADLLAEQKPEGAIEFAFIDTIVECWDALIQARELRTRTFTHDLEALLFGPDARKFQRMVRYIATCERNFTRAVRDLERAQFDRRRAEMTVTRKAESEARAAAKRAAAEYDVAMMARLCPPSVRFPEVNSAAATEPQTSARNDKMPPRFATVAGENLALRL
jgi:hypothetical protein